jgi:ABC-type sugar transport system permease subunit
MLVSLSTTIGHAVVAWLLVIPFLGALVFFTVRPLIRSFALRVAAARSKDIDHVA